MKIQYALVWRTMPVLNAIYQTCSFGRMRRRAKHNRARLSPFWEDITEWLRKDAEDNGWELGQLLTDLPWNDEAFIGRFNEFLLEVADDEFTPLRFPEEHMDHVDGITGADEDNIAWLFEENASKEEPEEEETKEAAGAE